MRLYLKHAWFPCIVGLWSRLWKNCHLTVCFPLVSISSLNEKRRVDRRKRPNEGTQLLYSIAGPTQKKFKINGGDIFELKEDAIIVNGSIKGVKLAAEGHGPQDIAVDLQDMLRESTFETERLLTAAGNPGSDPMLDMHGLYEKAFTAMNKAIFLMTQWKVAYDNGATANDPNNSNHMVSTWYCRMSTGKRVDGFPKLKADEEYFIHCDSFFF